MTAYDHDFTLSFTVKGSRCPHGEDVSGADLRQAVQRRLNSLSDMILVTVCGAPFDSAEHEIPKPVQLGFTFQFPCREGVGIIS